MATKKGGGGNRFTNRFGRLGNAAGNHPEKGKDSITAKGRESVAEKVATVQGKKLEPEKNNRFSGKFEYINPPASYDGLKEKLDKVWEAKHSPEKEK